MQKSSKSFDETRPPMCCLIHGNAYMIHTDILLLIQGHIFIHVSVCFVCPNHTFIGAEADATPVLQKNLTVLIVLSYVI